MSLRTPVDVSAWTTAITFGESMGGKDGVGIERLAPWCLDGNHDRSQSPRHFTHPGPEQAIHADDDHVARTHQVHERRFHPTRAGRAQGEGQVVLRPKDEPETLTSLVQ